MPCLRGQSSDYLSCVGYGILGAKKKSRFFTAAEATREILKFEDGIRSLSVIRKRIVDQESKCDAEEVTSYGLEGKEAENAKKRMDDHRARVRSYEQDFERQVRLLESLGCVLKGLDPGAVDLASKKDGEDIVLCWREGEKEVGYWHPPDAACNERRLLT